MFMLLVTTDFTLLIHEMLKFLMQYFSRNKKRRNQKSNMLTYLVWYILKEDDLGCEILPPVALTPQMYKMASHVQKSEPPLWYHEYKSKVIWQEDFVLSWKGTTNPNIHLCVIQFAGLGWLNFLQARVLLVTIH